MLVDGDPASDITGVGDYAVYCELAEGKGRTPPGVQGVDFTPYPGRAEARRVYGQSRRRVPLGGFGGAGGGGVRGAAGPGSGGIQEQKLICSPVVTFSVPPRRPLRLPFQ